MADTVKSGITNSPFVGVTNFHVAKLTDDAAGGTPKYDASVSIPWVRQVQIKPKNNSATLYADNMSVATANVMSEYDLTIETATLPLEYKALLLGHKIDAGKLTVSKDDVAPYFAVMFESTKQNGKKRYVRFVKVSLLSRTRRPRLKRIRLTIVRHL